VFEIQFTDDTVCVATRVLGLHHAHDPEGEKTSFYAQIDGAKRRIDPNVIKTMSRDWS